MNVGNLISGSCAFSEASLNIWKFTIHVLLKPSLENFEHYFASVRCVQLCSSLSIHWHCPSLGLEWKLTFSSPVAIAQYSTSILPTWSKCHFVHSRWNNELCSLTQSCPTLCDPLDCSLPGISQARILEWIAISSSRGSFWPRDWTCVSWIARGFLTYWAIEIGVQTLIIFT